MIPTDEDFNDKFEQVVFGLNFVSGKVFIFLQVFGDVKKNHLSIFSCKGIRRSSKSPFFYFFFQNVSKSHFQLFSCAVKLFYFPVQKFSDIPNQFLYFPAHQFSDIPNPIFYTFLQGIRRRSNSHLFTFFLHRWEAMLQPPLPRPVHQISAQQHIQPWPLCLQCLWPPREETQRGKNSCRYGQEPEAEGRECSAP